jgi:hypothetical protein
MEDLIPTELKMVSIMGEASNTLGVLIADVVVQPKEVRYAFFIIDGKPFYSIIIDKDSIHTNECVSSTLHQSLMF